MDLALLFILGTLWGSSYLFIKVTVAEVPALTLVAGRLLLAALLMAGLLRVLKLAMPRERRVWRHYAVLGLINMALPFSLITWGEQHISSGLASLLTSTLPIFTVLLAHVVSSDERITPHKLLGVGVGFAGVGILIWPDLQQGLEANLLGQLAVVAASLSYAAGTLYARDRLRGQAPLASAAGQITMAAAFMAPLSLLVDRPFDLSPSLPALASWVGLALLGTIVAYIMYFTLLARNSATFVSTVTYIVPVSGLLLGTLVLDEPLSGNLLISLALILTGVLLVRR
jgi:drug/metabolite transporter (DMT)-like permease